MKKYFIAILILIGFSAFGRCAIIDNMNVYVSPIGQKAHVVYNISYHSNQSTVSLITFYNIYNVHVYSGKNELNCNVASKSVGTLIVCKDINSKSIEISFYTNDIVKVKGNVYFMSMDIPITDVINHTTVKMELPSGFVIVDSNKLSYSNLKPYYPENGVTGSSGRTIYITWNVNNSELGKTLTFSVFYEPSSKSNLFIWFLIIIIIIIFSGGLFIFKSRQTKTILAALSPDEKKIMEIIFRKKKLYQKDIVKETEFSKAKVSRILKNFEERGLIKRERRGRKSNIKLLKFLR